MTTFKIFLACLCLTLSNGSPVDVIMSESVTPEPSESITSEELLELVENEAVLLIDVRPRSYIPKWGKIPTSHNVPVDELKEAFTQLSEEYFEEKYGFARPEPSDFFVLTCQSGVGARNGDKVLLELGYTNMKVHDGAFYEWLDKGYKIVFEKSPSISSEELLEIIEGEGALLIDVRPRSYLPKFGKIPTSHNLPVDEIKEAFTQLSEEYFEEKYGFARPAPEDPFIITCQSGVGARNADRILLELGYTNMRVHDGAYYDWVEKEYEIIYVDKPDSISFEELEELVEAESVVLIDVRPREYLKKYGKIPTSHNVPLEELEQAFSGSGLSDEEFQEEYGFVRPQPWEPFVLMCQSGGSARIAYQILQDIGYTNIRVYDGSFNEWLEKEGEVELVV